mmetsp:Transcript_5077/g.17082  ORF Transcript_5077/g.17082 Transcript_5077/m.17082 type:complete len:321 (-) Transcript_5077:207-1169(-)
MPTHPDALAKKTEGNAAFKGRNYERAIELYSEAIAIDNSDHTFFSNRSACYAELGRWEEAANDARQCIIVNRSFVKGYFRLAVALQNMEQVDAAIAEVKRGLGVDHANADLKRKLGELEALSREKRVAAALESAQRMRDAGDLQGALRAIDNGLRLEPQHRELQQLRDVVRPQFEQAERKRRSGMSPEEQLKESGDDKYRSAEFEAAIGLYTQALDRIGDRTSDLAIKCLSNRAACYKQLSNFEKVVEDCTAVLEVQPNSAKALIRRAQALEPQEKYRLALQDVRQVLAMPMNEVGQQTYQMANGMQHRLNRLVQQLRQA